MGLKKVLITGARRVIGLAIAEKLAGQYHLILHATSAKSFIADIQNSTKMCADFLELNHYLTSIAPGKGSINESLAYATAALPQPRNDHHHKSIVKNFRFIQES